LYQSSKHRVSYTMLRQEEELYSNRDIIRTFAYDQKAYRQMFLYWAKTGTVTQEAALFVQEPKGDFTLARVLFYDVSKCPQYMLHFQGQVQVRLMEDYIYHPNHPLEIIGRRFCAGVPSDILQPLTEKNRLHYEECLKWTMPMRMQFQRYPDPTHWCAREPPSQDKIVIVDAEYETKAEGTGNRVYPTMMALAVIKGSELIEYRSYLAPCPDAVGTKGMYSTRYSKYALMPHGGIQAFREYVYSLVEEGYTVYSKGPSIEAQILSDYGVRVPVDKRTKNEINLGTDRGRVVCAAVKEHLQGPESKSLGPPIVVYDLGCSSYDILSKYYFDQWSMELCVDVYEQTGFDSYDHNPVIEVITFAYHLLANRSLRRGGKVPVEFPVVKGSLGADPSRTTRKIYEAPPSPTVPFGRFHYEIFSHFGLPLDKVT